MVFANNRKYKHESERQNRKFSIRIRHISIKALICCRLNYCQNKIKKKVETFLTYTLITDSCNAIVF